MEVSETVNIRVEELRRNNYLFQKSRGINIQIDNPNGLHFIRAWGVDFPVNDFEYIPLTEGRLFMYGFEKREENIFWILNKHNFYINIEGDRLFCAFCTDAFEGVFENIIEIKYLHQLQNLYYSLTGEELEIKLTNIGYQLPATI